MDSEKLYKLARHFNKDIDFFFSKKSKREKDSFSFKVDLLENNFDEKLKAEMEKRFKLYHQIIELSAEPVKNYLPAEYNLKIEGKKLTKKEKAAIEKIAEKERRAMGVDDALNINVFSLFEENHIKLIAQEINNSNLESLSAYSKARGAYIFINDSKSISEEEKIFSAVKELGHLILNRDHYRIELSELKDTNSQLKDIQEKAAEYFAVAFLIPARVFKKYDYYFDGYLDLDLIIEKKKEFGVSLKTLIVILNEYGYLDDKTLKALVKKLKEAGCAKKEPEARDYIRKNEKLTALLRKLVIKEEITVNKAAEVLELSVLEMRKLVKKWKNYEYRTAEKL
jgi:Zn-dependent peptidase ImmA (M78 family)